MYWVFEKTRLTAPYRLDIFVLVNKDASTNGLFYLLIPAPCIVLLDIVDSYLIVYEKNFSCISRLCY